MGILIKEDSVWNQHNMGRRRRPESVDRLRKAALAAARPFRGPADPEIELELVLDQFISSIT